jgi:hypothetical protein
MAGETAIALIVSAAPDVVLIATGQGAMQLVDEVVGVDPSVV